MKYLLAATLFMLSTPSPAGPFLVAHRGASGDAPENTLPSFELAWKQGADAIEGDFHLTQDGTIVCIHDYDTKKVAGQKLIVKQSTLQQLRALDVGKWKKEEFAGTRVPTFDEVAAGVPEGKQIYIEVKCGPEIVPALLTRIEASHLQDEQIVVIAFDQTVIAEVKRRRPHWIANWLYSFDQKEPDSPTQKLPEVLRILKAIKANGLSSNSHPGLTKDHLSLLQSAGFQHHVWTVNDAEIARHFLDLGTQTITTDLPGKLREALSGE